jgi:hypothetical protein
MAAVASTTAVKTRDLLGSIEGPSIEDPPERELPAGSFIHFQALESTEREKSIIPPNDHFTVSNALLVSSISAAMANPHARFSSGQCRTAHPNSHRAKRATTGLS